MHTEQKIDVLGVGFDDITIEQAVHRACEMLDRAEKTYIVTPNPEMVWAARRDEILRIAINSAGLVLPDGIGIILGARILGTPLRGGRVSGIDFAVSLLVKMAQSGRSLFLLGAKPGVAERAGQVLCGRYPGLVIAGASDGYFTDDSAVISEINQKQPDVLFVCLGSPKQENWMFGNVEQLNTKLCVGLGGALDVFSGNVRRAPVFMQKSGLEWLYRLFREPKRIKRMIKLPLFVIVLIWKKVING